MNTVAFSPDGRYALTGSGDGTARIWPLFETGVKEEEDFSFERSFDVPTLEGKFAPGEFVIKAHVKKVGTKFYVEISIAGTVRTECHRCLDEFDMHI